MEADQKKILTDEEYTEIIVRQIRDDLDKPAISQKLVEQGMEQTKADALVERIYGETMKLIEKETITTNTIWLGLLGAGAAAIVGGILWGLMVILTNHEVGYAAIGMGLLCGYAVVWVSRKNGLTLQIIAVALSVVGIVIGKYITYAYFFQQSFKKEIVKYGTEAVANNPVPSILSGTILSGFFRDFTSMLSGFDLLWVALAITMAWKIPKATGFKLLNKK